jgi:hypothetical protein
MDTTSRLNTDEEYFQALEQIEALNVTGPASWANLSGSARGFLLGIDAQLREYEQRTQRYRTAVL